MEKYGENGNKGEIWRQQILAARYAVCFTRHKKIEMILRENGFYKHQVASKSLKKIRLYCIYIQGKSSQLANFLAYFFTLIQCKR